MEADVGRCRPMALSAKVATPVTHYYSIGANDGGGDC